MHENLVLVDHPLIQHKLTLMREKTTPSAQFRRLLKEISLLLGYETLRDLPLTTRRIETPLAAMEAPILKGKKLALVPILRAGIGLLDGMLELSPLARVGFIGLFRDEETLKPVQYSSPCKPVQYYSKLHYSKLPKELDRRVTVMLDPMLATGNSAAAAIDIVKEAGAKDVRFMCLLAAPEGVENLARQHPDVPIISAALDERLNDQGYIVPGLGDAGDRLFGTR